MKMLMWDKFNKFAVDDQGEIQISEIPNLGFDYSEIRYVENGEQWIVAEHGEKYHLTVEVIKLIEKYLVELRAANPRTYLVADAAGKYVGAVIDPTGMQIVPYAPPNADPHRWINDSWTRVYPVDANGFLTYEHTAVLFVTKAPPDNEAKWDEANEVWSDTVPFDDRIRAAAGFILSSVLSKSYGGEKSLDQEQCIALVKAIASIARPGIVIDVDAVVLTIEDLFGFCKEKADINVLLSQFMDEVM